MNKALRHLLSVEPGFSDIIQAAPEFEIEHNRFGSVFEALCHSITYQQLSGKAASTIYGRFTQAFGRAGKPVARRVLDADADALRACGLSRPKLSYIQGLASAQQKRKLPTFDQLQHMDDEDIIMTLTEHKGVGVWTVQMLLIFWLGRPDVLPDLDLGVQKGLQNLHGLPSLPKPAELRAAGESWRPYRSLASWYLWRLSET